MQRRSPVSGHAIKLKSFTSNQNPLDDLDAKSQHEAQLDQTFCENSRGKDWARIGIELGNLNGADQELAGIWLNDACTASTSAMT